MAAYRIRCFLSKIKRPSWVSVNTTRVSSDHPSRFLNTGINLVGDSFHRYSDKHENKFYFPKIALGVVGMSLMAEPVEDQEDSIAEDDGQNLNDEEVDNDTDSSHDDDATEPVDTRGKYSCTCADKYRGNQ